VRRCFSHVRSSGVFGQAKLFVLLVLHIILGFRRLRGLDYYRDDPVVARVLGLRRLPDVATVSRMLSNVDQQSVDKLGLLSGELVLDRLSEEGFARVTLDFDGSVQSTKGHREGTAVGFNKQKKGARSYYPLFCTVAQTGQFLDFHHRSGNVHDSNGARAFMTSCIYTFRERLPTTTLETRIDSAFFASDILLSLDVEGIEFTCSVPFLRLPDLKTIVEGRKRWRRLDATWSYFETSWRPKSWEVGQDYRFICVRRRNHKQRKGPLQLDLFEPKDFTYDYKVIVTNRAVSAKAVLQFHNGRGSQEAIFGEAKQDAALGVLPSRSQAGNKLFTTASVTAHNLGRELQMRSQNASRPTLPKRPPRWEFEALGTIRQLLLHRAGRLTRPKGELVLRMSANTTVCEKFSACLESLRLVA
jgi:hypothetical protein